MNAKEFYESYWASDKAPPRLDPTTAERMQRLERVLGSVVENSNRGTLRVLDAGCGDGIFVTVLRQLGFQVSGVDVSQAAIAKTRTQCPDVDLHVGSLEDPLPFRDGVFDAVWCTEVLEHIFNVHTTLAEFNRVLRLGGTLVLTTPYHGFVKNLAIALMRFEKHFNPELSHIRFFTRITLDRCLKRAGFDSVTWAGVGRVWPIWKSFFVTARKLRAPGPAPAIIG